MCIYRQQVVNHELDGCPWVTVECVLLERCKLYIANMHIEGFQCPNEGYEGYDESGWISIRQDRCSIGTCGKTPNEEIGESSTDTHPKRTQPLGDTAWKGKGKPYPVKVHQKRKPRRKTTG